MKVFIKILGLIGLVNCIVLYGAESKKGDSVNERRSSIAAKLDALELGDYVASAADIGIGVYDPASGVRQERRSSQDPLMQSFAQEYADDARQAQQQSAFEALISRFKDKDNRTFARRFLRGRTVAERQQLNAGAASSPVHRTRRLSTGDGQADTVDSTMNKVDKQALLVEALMLGMQRDLAQKDQIHREETALLQKQHKERSEQLDRLGQIASNDSRCAMMTSAVLGSASLALSIAAFAHTS